MQVVHFPEELHARAPSAVGVLCFAPTNEWGTLFNVIDLVRTGETVTIRPATEQEVERAEQLVVLHEIGQELSQCIGKLLDHEPPEVVDQHRAQLAEAILSTNLPIPDLIREEVAPESAATAAVPELRQADPLDALPGLYNALRHAHALGAGDAVASLDADIQAVLRGEMTAETAFAIARAHARATAQ